MCSRAQSNHPDGSDGITLQGYWKVLLEIRPRYCPWECKVASRLASLTVVSRVNSRGSSVPRRLAMYAGEERKHLSGKSFVELGRVVGLSKRYIFTIANI